jgi:hypothetical protein
MTSPARRTITSSPTRTPFAANLEQVVQRRVRDRRSADEDRLELGHGRQLAGSPDLDADVVEARRLLLRRILLRHRPARLARLEAELVLKRAVVDLVDDSVDLVRQGRALRRDRVVELDQAARAEHALVHRARGQPDLRQRGEQAGLRRRNLPAVDLAETVREEAERSLRRIARIELADHAGGRIARIDEDLLVLRAAFDELSLARVERSEIVEAHEDLAAHLETRASTPLRRLGTAAIVRTVCVTSSPVSPSPRVAAWTRSPRS